MSDGVPSLPRDDGPEAPPAGAPVSSMVLSPILERV